LIDVAVQLLGDLQLQKNTRQHFVATDCFIREEILGKTLVFLKKIRLGETLLISPARGTDLGYQAARLWSTRCYSGTAPVLPYL